MNNVTKIIIALVLVAIIAAGAIMLTGKPGRDTNNNTSGTGETKTVMYASSGFSPNEVTLKSGDSLKVVNDTDEEIEPSSNPHPVHTDNPELNFGDIEPGQSKTLKLSATGTWGYHNHYHKDHGAAVVVE